VLEPTAFVHVWYTKRFRYHTLHFYHIWNVTIHKTNVTNHTPHVKRRNCVPCLCVVMPWSQKFASKE
jgi:hypothetical protein